MKKTTKKAKAIKKAISTTCGYQSTWTYHGIVDLPIFSGRIFNHGTASSKNTRTRTHIRECEKNDLTYKVLVSKSDRLFGNTVIAPTYDKEFIVKVVERINDTVLKNSTVKAMTLKDWQSSLTVLTSAKQGYYDSVCKAKLSETECCFVPDVVSQDELDAVINFVEQSWYYVDKTLRVPARKLPGNLHFKQKHLVSGKLVKVIRDRFPIAKKMMYTPGNTIVLIGQFCPESVATFAMINNVIIWHDSADQKHVYKEDDELNERITYIETMEELLDICMNVDPKTLLIIANSPYKAPGANITKTIVDNINYAEFVNLLPVNDYKRVRNLYKHVALATIVPVKKGFADAAVTTHIAKINKHPGNFSVEEFEIESYIDPDMTKYFYTTRARDHYAIDKACWPKWKSEFIKIITPDTTFTIWQRDVAHGHMPYTKDCKSYQWNVLKAFDADWFEANCINTQGISNGALLTFNTAVEKENFTEWFYSKTGFRFISKVFTAVNVDSGVYSLYRLLPKVDWTRPWTTEEILADYGYTPSEIDKVMTDLFNFKGMED